MIKNQTPVLSNGSSTGWVYDAAGEATNLGASVGSTSQTGLVWDGLGRLSQVNAPGLTETEGYAPSGMRVRRDDSVAGLSRRYVYTIGGLLLGEYIPASGGGFAWNRDVIYVGSEAVAEIDGNGMHELHSDHLGTPRVITTSSSGTGVIEGRQNFGPYGEMFPAMNSGYAPITGYTGHLQADPSGLIYMRGRYYTPIWHRFVNSDQGADPSTFNQVAYVGGSPMMVVDPSGMQVKEPTITVPYIGELSPIDEVGGGGGGFWDASYAGPLYFMPVTIPKGGGGGGNTTSPQQAKADCVAKAKADLAQALNDAKKMLDLPGRTAYERYSEGYSNSGFFGVKDPMANDVIAGGVGAVGGSASVNSAVLWRAAQIGGKGSLAESNFLAFGRAAGPLGFVLSISPSLGHATAGLFNIANGAEMDKLDNKLKYDEAIISAREAYHSALDGCK